MDACMMMAYCIKSNIHETQVACTFIFMHDTGTQITCAVNDSISVSMRSEMSLEGVDDGS